MVARLLAPSFYIRSYTSNIDVNDALKYVNLLYICTDNKSSASLCDLGPTFLQCVDTSGETKDVQFTAAAICSAIEKVGPTSIVQVITDSAANCKAAWQIIQQKYPRIVCSPCAAHCSDLLLEDWGKLQIASVISKVSDVVNFIAGHDGSCALLRKLSPEKGLLKPAETRFSTTVFMAERVLQLKDVLQEMVVSHEYKAWIQKKPYKETSDKISKLLLSEEFWKKCQVYFDVNEPVFQLLRLIDGSAPVIGKIYYRMYEVQKKINNFVGLTAFQRTQLYQYFVSRWAMLHTNLHYTGFLLDPEFLGMAQNTNEEVMSGLSKCFQKQEIRF